MRKGESKYWQLNDKQWLEEKYFWEGLSCREIAVIVGCNKSTVLDAFKRLNILRRTIPEANRNRIKYPELHDKKWLEEKYLDEKLSSLKIAEIIGCDSVSVRRALRYFSIPIRTISEALKGKEISEKTKNKMSAAQKGHRCGEENPFYGKHHTEETKNKRREDRKHQRFPAHHTKPELLFEGFCKKDTLPFRYTGDSSFWIGKGKDVINPDFVHLTKKIVVEIFSWFHDELRNQHVQLKGRYGTRKKIYKKYGWKMIVFWQEDLEREDVEEYVLSVLRKEKAI